MAAPNVVVLIFDTLRSDYLGCYGGPCETPALDALAREGVLFESAFGTAPGTPVSHASLYTGQYPSEHGVTGQYIELPPGPPTVAEWLREAGYETFGITGPAKMGSTWGYDRGFDELYEPHAEFPDPTSAAGLARVCTDRRYAAWFHEQLTAGGSEKTTFKFDLLRDRIADDLSGPFFALANFLTVHAPYDPPRPHRQRVRPDYSRPRWNVVEHLREDTGSIDHPDVRLDRVANAQRVDGISRYLADPGYLNDAEEQLLRDWYAACVEYLDSVFAEFLEFYRRELAEDTYLVVTADHGEQLGEHGLWEHSHGLHDETLRVPLLVCGPDLEGGRRRTDLVSHVDLLDTLCDLCGVDAPGSTSGRSVFAGDPREAVYMEYGERDPAEFLSGDSHGQYMTEERAERFTPGRKAVRTADYRYELTSRGDERLFDAETGDRVPSPPRDVVAELRSDLVATLGEEFGVWPEGEPDSASVTADVRANLRELGYIQ